MDGINDKMEEYLELKRELDKLEEAQEILESFLHQDEVEDFMEELDEFLAIQSESKKRRG